MKCCSVLLLTIVNSAYLGASATPIPPPPPATSLTVGLLHVCSWDTPLIIVVIDVSIPSRGACLPHVMCTSMKTSSPSPPIQPLIPRPPLYHLPLLHFCRYSITMVPPPRRLCPAPHQHHDPPRPAPLLRARRRPQAVPWDLQGAARGSRPRARDLHRTARLLRLLRPRARAVWIQQTRCGLRPTAPPRRLRPRPRLHRHRRGR